MHACCSFCFSFCQEVGVDRGVARAVCRTHVLIRLPHLVQFARLANDRSPACRENVDYWSSQKTYNTFHS